jgi:hypothetical protein
MGWNGDISRMGKLADRIRDLAEVPSRAAKKVSAQLAGLLQQEFDAGHDPYGTPWKPLAKTTVDRGRFPPPLTDTYAMRQSAQAKPLKGSGVGVTIAHPAAPHQTGWSGPQGKGPARPILPAKSKLPEDWNEVIEDAVDAEVRRGHP